MTARVLWTAVVLVAAIAGAGPTARADTGGVTLTAGIHPTAGPDLLREPITTAPPLTNAAPWHAEPLLVSGALAYRDGELLYQDFLFDDHGADGIRDPLQPQPYGVAVPIGSYTYPTGADFHGNDADIVEVRLQLHGDETLFRVTFNTMVEPIVSAFTLALGRTTSDVRDYPFGANVRGPADAFVTVHGSTAMGGGATATVDLERQQVTVAVPFATWDPRGGDATVAVGAGLWDRQADVYLAPQQLTSDTHPGGAGAIENPPAFFNVAFRTDEPIGGQNQHWSNARQAAALAVHDMTPFTVGVDDGVLRRHADVDVVVPTTGSIDRIMSSRFDLGVGVDLGNSCGLGSVRGCTGQMLTRLQPYNLFVPELAAGADAYGLTVHLHSLNANHNQYANTNNQRQYAMRDQGTLVMTPLARGADSQYYDHGLANVFEVWADVAAHYPLEPAFTSVAGYSMGGFGTFKLAMSYPDLFARGHATVGSAYPHEMRLPSLRNVPMLMWNATADYLVPVAEPLLDFEEAARYGIRLELDLFHTTEHLMLGLNDEYGPGAAFLGDHRVDDDPPIVTYIVNPIDLAEHGPLGLNADHAYWLSGMRVRTPGSDTGGRDTFSDGRVDAHSHAFGIGDSARRPPETGVGVLEGGRLGPLPYTRHTLEWDGPVAIEAADRLDLTLVNLSAVTVDMARAGLTCAAEVNVVTDGPVDVTLDGCGETRRYDAA